MNQDQPPFSPPLRKGGTWGGIRASRPKGAILMLSLVFLGLFVFTGVGLVSMTEMQRKLTVKKVSSNQALQLAEAGLNYYRWHLAHDSLDFTDGTGEPGPYVHQVSDPLGGPMGSFSLVVTPQSSCTYTLPAPGIDIEAEDMTFDHCDCSIIAGPPEHVLIKKGQGGSPGLIAQNITVSDDATYTIEYKLKGTQHSGSWPNAKITLDGNRNLGTFSVNSTNWQTYSFSVFLTAGTHTIEIEHLNAHSSGNRRLYVDYLSITAEDLPGTTVNESNAVIVRSTGYTVADPNAERVLEARFGKRSLADYAFLVNSNVWFGNTEAVYGPLHSNGGIRMDGSHNTTATSARETYVCGSEHGCSNQTKPGIWGTGGNPDLWSFPVPPIDFNELTTDLAHLKFLAENAGLYLAPAGFGYRISFQSNGTMNVYRVDSLRPAVLSYNGTSWVSVSHDIQTQTLLGNYALPTNCGVIFVEDDVWVDGVVRGRVTLVSASLPDVASTNTTAIINGNITYTTRDGSDSLGLIAQKDILIPLYAAPNDLEINAVLLAQKGHVFRNHYSNTASPYHIRNSVTLYGSIITNGLWTFSWVNSGGTVISGYVNTYTEYDSYLSFQPPPGFPTSGDYSIVRWEEVTEK